MNNELQNNEQILDLLIKTGLNWEVSKEQLFAPDNTPTRAYGTFKKTDRIFLGAVSNRYEPYQNWQLAEAMVAASEEVGLEFTRGGELARGRKVYLQAPLPDRFIGKSEVKRMITALNSHDGTTAIGFGSSNTVVVCGNTFNRAYSDIIDQNSSVRHVFDAHEQVMSLAKALRETIRRDDQLMVQFERLSETSVKGSDIDRLLKDIFGADVTSQERPATLKKFDEALEIETDLAGNSAWGVFNAVTRYTNHMARTKNREDYLMIGNGYNINNKAFKLLTSLS